MKKIFSLLLIAAIFISLFCATAFAGIKEVSYVPRGFDLGTFWKSWRNGIRQQMDADLDLIKDMKADTVRLIINPHEVGYPQPRPDFLADFEEALALLANHNFKAHVTLFSFDDFYPSTECDATEPAERKIDRVITESKSWLNKVVDPHKTDNRIAIWELTNEIVLYARDQEGNLTHKPIIRAHQWLGALFPYLKQKIGSEINGPYCTVSVSAVEWLKDIKRVYSVTSDRNNKNLYNLHWYPDFKTWTRPLPAILVKAREIIGDSKKRLMLGEVGCDTYYMTEEAQKNLFQDVFYYASRDKIEGKEVGVRDIGVWLLNDLPFNIQRCRFTYGGNMSCSAIEAQDRPQLRYGIFYITAGKNTLGPKPAFGLIQEAFNKDNLLSSRSDTTLFNASFESLNSDGTRLTNWFSEPELKTQRYFEQITDSCHHDSKCHIPQSGNALVAVNVPTPRGNPEVGLFHLPFFPIGPGKTCTLRAYVACEGCNQYRQNDDYWLKLALYFYNKYGGLIETKYSPAFSSYNPNNWEEMTLSATAPAEAVYVMPYLKFKTDYSFKIAWFDNVQFSVSPVSNSLIELPSPYSPYSEEIGLSLPVSAKWQFISLPLTGAHHDEGVFCSDPANLAGCLFPTRSDGPKTADEVPVNQPLVGKGYWIKFNANQCIPVFGKPIKAQEIVVSEGWNLIGALTYPIYASSVISDPPGIIESDFLGYEGSSYEPADMLMPGKGYWVEVKQNGRLILSIDPTITIPRPDLGGLNSFNFTDKDGNSGDLYFGSTSDAFPESSVELPRAGEGFDVRFKSDIVGYNGSNAKIFSSLAAPQQYTISISKATYPIVLSYYLGQTNYKSYLTYINNKGKEKKIAMRVNNSRPVKIGSKKEAITELILHVENTLPKFSALKDKTTAYRMTLKFKVAARDKDNDTLTLTAKCRGMDVNVGLLGTSFTTEGGENGKISGEYIFKPPSVYKGMVFPIDFEVVDALGGSVKQTINITVK